MHKSKRKTFLGEENCFQIDEINNIFQKSSLTQLCQQPGSQSLFMKTKGDFGGF